MMQAEREGMMQLSLFVQQIHMIKGPYRHCVL